MLANGFTAFLVWILSAFITANWLNRNIIIYLDKLIQKVQGRGPLFALLKMRSCVKSLNVMQVAQ
jgi:hypothetical protein